MGELASECVNLNHFRRTYDLIGVDVTLLIEWPNGITLHSPRTTQLALTR